MYVSSGREFRSGGSEHDSVDARPSPGHFPRPPFPRWLTAARETAAIKVGPARAEFKGKKVGGVTDSCEQRYNARHCPVSANYVCRRASSFIRRVSAIFSASSGSIGSSSAWILR